jgi:SNF2 family DNA or RNA helicase
VQQILGERDDATATQTDDESGDSDQQFYVKFAGKAHVHNQWLTERAILDMEGGESALHRYHSRLQHFSLTQSLSIPSLMTYDDSTLNSAWFEVDRILDEIGDGETRRYFVKWKLQNYDEATWEKSDVVPADKVANFEARLDRSNPTKIPKRWVHPSPDAFATDENVVQSKLGDFLRDYQMEGYNWLRFCWYNSRNSILADEMGLGKTAQIVAALDSLGRENVTGPFLVVAPLSTLDHWKTEFERWSSLNAVVYHGNQAARDLIRATEFVAVDSDGRVLHNRVQFDAIVTNYETVLQDFAVFAAIEWRYLVLDEAHRLKRSTGKLYQKMETLVFEHCTMLTGTPIQNCIEELWGLLHFLYPAEFSDLDDFTESYGNTSDAEQVLAIQKIIQPIMLRRKKSDVEKAILPKEETIVEVELTRTQKKLYRGFLHENAGTLLQQLTGGALPSLQNLMMQLRKVCNHPYLIKGVEAEVLREKRTELGPSVSKREASLRAIVESSGKMIFIDKLLPKLREGGHKVLIFSQMVRILSIIEDYLHYHGYPFERIDGSVAEPERQRAIESFNATPDVFIFLLSTRAGGVGINLTAADTVIIYDSDWNPQNDIQAQARCHRIGQKAKVKVYRLITRNTYENKMFERASRKLGLDHVVLDGGEMNNKPMQVAEIEEILRHGVHGIFNDDDNEADQFCADDIDQILERRATSYTSDIVSGGGSIFAKARFDGTQDAALDMNAKDFWAQVLPMGHGSRFADSLAMRRCRQQKPAKEEPPVERPLQPSRIVTNLLHFGFRARQGEDPFVRYALTFCDVEDESLASLLSPFLEQEDDSSDDEAVSFDPHKFVKDLGAAQAGLIEEKAATIIERVLFFFRLRRMLLFVQGPGVEWPSLLPEWRPPQMEYALALAVAKLGWREGPGAIGDAEFGLADAPPMKAGQAPRRLLQIMEELEAEMPDDLGVPPLDFEPMSPPQWLEAHPPPVLRGEMVDGEIVCELRAMTAFGLPENDAGEPDWAALQSYAGLSFVSLEAVAATGDELLRLVASEPEGDELDLSSFPILELARDYFSMRDVTKLGQNLRFMSSIRQCVSNMNPAVLEVMKAADSPPRGPDWWTWECDQALLTSMAKHGLIRCWGWLLDKSLPFRKCIPRRAVGEFERAAALELEKMTPVRLGIELPAGFELLATSANRIHRAMKVINYTTKKLGKAALNRKENEMTLPLTSGSLTVLALGQLLPENPSWDGKAGPIPLGFVSEREYALAHWPSDIKFRCTIEAAKGKPAYRVRVLAGDSPEVVAANPTTAVKMAVDRANEIVANAGNPQPAGQRLETMPGMTFVGLSLRRVRAAIATLHAELPAPDLTEGAAQPPFQVVLPEIQLN